jgi:hypothetical protein
MRATSEGYVIAEGVRWERKGYRAGHVREPVIPNPTKVDAGKLTYYTGQRIIPEMGGWVWGTLDKAEVYPSVRAACEVTEEMGRACLVLPTADADAWEHTRYMRLMRYNAARIGKGKP